MIPSTEVKESLILFNDNSKVWITKEQYLDVFFTDKNEHFIIKDTGTRYNMATVKKIFENAEEYYNEYPDQRPVNRELIQIAPVEKKFGSKRAIRGIINGLKNYIASSDYKGTQVPKELLRHWENKL